MPEVGQLLDRRRRQHLRVRGVELLAGDRQHQFAGVHQGGQQHHHPRRLQPVGVRRQVLHVLHGVDQLRAVEDLPRSLGAQRLDHVPGVPGAAGVEPVAVEQLQGVQDLGALLRPGGAGDPPQRVARRLRPAGRGLVIRKRRILRRLLLEVGGQRGRSDRVHEIAHVGPRAGAAGSPHPSHERLGPAPAGDLERRGHPLLQPVGQLLEEPLRPPFVGFLRRSRRTGGQVDGGGVAP